MKKHLLFAFLVLTISHVINGQISLKDSTVQVIGYWDIGDKQSFELSYDKYKIKKNDTTSIMKVLYEVDITVKDSTENSYTIEWFYKNYNIQTDNELIQKLSKVAEDLSVIIKTNEFGEFIEVVNWEKVRDYILKSVKIIKKEYEHIPNIDKILEQTQMMYSSKEAIESNTIKDIQQYYSFHGGKYLLNEKLTGVLKTHNNFGGENFDTNTEVSLDEINEEDGNSVLRMYNSIDSNQLTNATFEYLKSMAEAAGGNPPKREDISLITNETWMASRIHGETGWVIFSINTKEVSADDSRSVEETIINLK